MLRALHTQAKTAIGWMVFAILIGSPHMVSAEENFADSIEESFVEFRFKKTGDSFYRVMMDFDEIPYLDIEEVMNNWLEMQVECQPERLYCQGVMIHNGKGFWVDGEQRIFGQSESEQDQSLPENSLVVKENRLWLRYDVWEKWLPVNVVWSMQRYTLNMQPHFALKEDRKELRKKARLRQWQRQRKIERLATIPPIHPEDPYRAELRYNVTASQFADGDRALDMTYDMGADIWEGHLVLSGVTASEDDKTDLVNYWRFQQIDRPYFHLLEVGDTRFDSTLLAPALDLHNGLRIDRSERQRGSGTFELRSRTAPNTEIELIINGFLQDIIFADGEGNFEISRRLVSSGDRINLRFFYDDGSNDEITILIAADDAMIIKPQTWDGRVLAGDTPQGVFAHVEARYGLWEDFSVATHLYQIPLPDFESESSSLVVSMDMGWRPFPGLSLLAEVAKNDEHLDYSFQSDLSKWSNHTIQFQSQRVDPQSIWARAGLFNFEFLSFHRLQHAFRFAPWSLLTRYTDTPNKTLIDLNVDRRLTRDINLFAELEQEQPDTGEALETLVLGTTYQRSEFSTLELARNFSDMSSGWTLRYRYVGKTENPWSKQESNSPWRATLNAVILDDGDNAYSLGISWRNNRYLSSTLQLDQNGVNFALLWRDAYSLAPTDKEPGWDWQRHRWNHYGSGTLEGYVMAPKSPGKPAQPLRGVQVRARGLQAFTDQNGYYQITGLPVHARVVVKVNKNTLDASMAPVEEAEVVVFRPATKIRLDPQITWTAGLDGVLYTDKSIPGGTLIEVTRVEDGKVIGTAPVEFDGFFLFEGLTPNDYEISFLGLDNPPPPHQVNIPPGTDWLPGIEIEWHPDES